MERERNAIFFFVMSAQPFLRIFGAIVLTDFKIEEARRRLLTLAHSCNRLARRDAVTRCDGRRLEISVQ